MSNTKKLSKDELIEKSCYILADIREELEKQNRLLSIQTDLLEQIAHSQYR